MFIKNHKEVICMKIGDAAKIYSAQLKDFWEQKRTLAKQKKDLEETESVAADEQVVVSSDLLHALADETGVVAVCLHADYLCTSP